VKHPLIRSVRMENGALP